MAARQPVDLTCLLGCAEAGQWKWERRIACARSVAAKQQELMHICARREQPAARTRML